MSPSGAAASRAVGGPRQAGDMVQVGAVESKPMDLKQDAAVGSKKLKVGHATSRHSHSF